MRSWDSQGVDSIGAGEGESWTAAPGSGPNVLGEVFLLGQTTFDPSEVIGLGRAYNTAIVDEGITFTYQDPIREEIIVGTVEYTTVVTEIRRL